MTIPRLPIRLDCMLYRRRMELEMEELKPELLILKAAAQEMRESRRLKDLLGVSCDRNLRLCSLCRLTDVPGRHQIVLALGNALNASTFRGNARGFQLESLLKVGLAASCDIKMLISRGRAASRHPGIIC